MALNIKDPETDRLARDLAAATGESITKAVAVALEERLLRVRGRSDKGDLVADLREIGERVALLPVLDDRTDEEIIGYGEFGEPI